MLGIDLALERATDVDNFDGAGAFGNATTDSNKPFWASELLETQL